MDLFDTFGMAEFTADLTIDEGRRKFAYLDTRGNLSIGVGRNLSGVGLLDAEIDFLLTNDVRASCTLLDADHAWWRQMPAAKQRVLLNLCFNMGEHTLDEFVIFLGYMQAGNWPDAAHALQQSAWWGEVGARGPRMVARLLAPADEPAGGPAPTPAGEPVPTPAGEPVNA